MNADFDRMLAERTIEMARPACGPFAVACLVIAGLLVACISSPLLLTGLFTSGPVFVLGWVGVGVSVTYLLLAWALYGGHLWSWWAAVVLTLSTMLFAAWIFAAFPVLSGALLVVLLAVQLMLWHGSLRAWIFRAQRLRSRGLEGVPSDAR
jgi:hypothetical protein